MTFEMLPIVVGQAFDHQKTRLVYRGRVGDRMHVETITGDVYLVDDDETDGQAMPSVFWFLREYLGSRISIPSSAASDDDRYERLERLDLAAAVLRDPVSLKRLTWGRMALKAGFSQNEAAIGEWIASTPAPDVPELPFKTSKCPKRVRLDLRLRAAFAEKPGARSVMIWMKTLKAGGGIGALVNKAGRPLGHSQLPATTDRLVGRASELFYEDRESFPSMEDAAALVVRWWELLKADGAEDIGATAPDYETVRQRIRKSETFANYEKRYGRYAAIAKFGPKGEPIEVTRPFERVWVDGTEFRHLTRYSAEWGELAGKLRGVAAMDAFSLYKWKYSVFYGPFRPAMSLEALMHVFVSPEVDEQDIVADPTVAIFGIPSLIAFDNDRAILPPSLVPQLMTLGEVELLDVYHPDGKSPLEVSFKHDKQRLAGIKGCVLPPRRARDPKYDPAEEADLTKAQFAIEVERARRDWNRTPKTVLGERSPEDVMLDYIRSVGVQRYHGPR